MEEKKTFKESALFNWFVNNKTVTVLLVTLLIFLNVFVLYKINFIFSPVGDFITTISLPIVLAAVFYYLLNPVVNFLEKKKWPRVLSISLLFAILAGLLIWGIVELIPAAATNIDNFSHRVPTYVDSSQNEINKLLVNPKFDQFKPQIDDIMNSVGNSLVDWSKNFSGTLATSITNVIGHTFEVIISLVIFPFVLFYLLRDGNSMNEKVTQILPPAWRKDTSEILTDMNKQISNYVRGQVIVALSVMLIFLITLPLIGLRYAVGVAIMAGLFNLVPFFGSMFALIIASVIGLITGGPLMLAKVIIVFVIEQTVEGRFISPLVLGAHMKIHPITILFVILTAGKIFGIWGVIIGVPAYAAAKVIIVHLYEWYREVSDVYKTNEEVIEEKKS
ncbi:MAG: AI-2E family transporter [Streptococcaceae bacterium]|nr:AI-2E family transporter [Streptococcaceae bacterium]